MSIYATLWELRFPRDGIGHPDAGWLTVLAQAVPDFIGSPDNPDYKDGDPYAAFLPPAIRCNPNRDEREPELSPAYRAVVIVTEETRKGTARSAQEYDNPLLVLTGDEYQRISFDELHERIMQAIRQR